jgi:hypothetical protein
LAARKYAATDPAASIPKSTVLLLRQQVRIARFTGGPFPSLRDSPEGSRPGTLFHHRFHRDPRGFHLSIGRGTAEILTVRTGLFSM